MRTIDFSCKVVSLLIRTELIAPAQVPFTHIARGISGLLHRFGNRDHIEGQSHGGLRIDYPFKGTPVTGNVCGDSNACLVLSRLYCTAGGRAYRTGGIKIGKAHAVLGQLIDVGRIDEVISIATNISPAHIINEYKDDVGFGILLCDSPVG